MSGGERAAEEGKKKVLFRPQAMKHQPLGDGWEWEGGSLVVGYGRVLPGIFEMQQ